jgi:hypothetical protein
MWVKKIFSFILLSFLLVNLSQVWCSTDKTGNTNSNISNNSIVAQNGSAIYYPGKNSGIYSIIDSKIKLISHDKTDGVSVMNGWIYYSCLDNICKIRVDGTKKTVLRKCASGGLLVTSKYIFFINYDDKNKIYRMDLSGKNLLKISNIEDVYDINHYNDWIYFLSGMTKKIYKVTADGSKFMRLGTDLSYDMTVYKNQVYYTNCGKGNHLYKMNLDGKERTELIKADVTAINIFKKNIYYVDYNKCGYLFRTSLTGKGRTRILKVPRFFDIGIVDGWIFYTIEDVGGPFKVKHRL